MGPPVPLMKSKDSTCCDPPPPMLLPSQPLSGAFPLPAHLPGPHLLPRLTRLSASERRRGEGPVSILTTLGKLEGPLGRFSGIQSLTLGLAHSADRPSSRLRWSSPLNAGEQSGQGSRPSLASWTPVGIVLFLLKAWRGPLCRAHRIDHAPGPLGHKFLWAPQAMGELGVG